MERTTQSPALPRYPEARRPPSSNRKFLAMRGRGRELGLRAGSGAGFGCGLPFGWFVGHDAKSFDLQALIHVEALLAVQALDEFARGFSDGAGNAGSVYLDRAAFGADFTVFVFQSDVVGVHGCLFPLSRFQFSHFRGWYVQSRSKALPLAIMNGQRLPRTAKNRLASGRLRSSKQSGAREQNPPRAQKLAETWLRCA